MFKKEKDTDETHQPTAGNGIKHENKCFHAATFDSINSMEVCVLPGR